MINLDSFFSFGILRLKRVCQGLKHLRRMTMKKSIKILLASLVIFTCGAVSAFAAPLDYESAVGVSFLTTFDSMAIGGLQYQRWISDKFGIQTEGAIMYQPDSYNNMLDYNINVEFQYKLFETPMGAKNATILYGWILAGHRGFQDKDYNDATQKWTKQKFKADAVAGIGFGFDVMLLNHISIPFNFGLVGEFPNDSAAGFCLGSGVRYRF